MMAVMAVMACSASSWSASDWLSHPSSAAMSPCWASTSAPSTVVVGMTPMVSPVLGSTRTLATDVKGTSSLGIREPTGAMVRRPG